MRQVTSTDGTSIAYDRQGDGPAVILVTGGLDDGSENAPLARELARSLTAYNYARRGRGDSGDTQPYALEREVEDIAALIAEAGGSAHLYGVSSGGALILEAAATGLSGVDKLAVYEVPYNLADDWPPHWRAYVEEVEAALAEGRRGRALEAFHRLTGFSEEEIAAARSSPHWSGAEALAHTLAYDAACLRDGRPPVARLAKVTQPTLVMRGGTEFFGPAADAIAASIPNAERRILEGQGHVVDPKVMASELVRFFGA